MAQIFDDGSSIETFDDGSTLVTDTTGKVSSTPALPDPPATSPNTSGFFSKVGTAISDTATGAYNAVTRSLSPTPSALGGIVGGAIASRLAGAGLNAGGTSTPGLSSNPVVNIQTQAGTSAAKDWRVRVSLPTGSSLLDTAVTGPGSILGRTNGVVFPYTPTITVVHNARYQEQALTHSNYKNYFYEGSDVAAITIAGDFTVQNIDEGQYLLGVIYFFRTCTKMFFGEKENSKNAGNPPPIVYLDGYGTFYLPHVSCVVTSFSHTMPDNVDYLEIPSTTGTSQSTGKNPTPSTGTTRLPTSSQIQVTLQPVYSRKNIYEKFTLSSFASGALLGSSSGSSNTSGFL